MVPKIRGTRESFGSKASLPEEDCQVQSGVGYPSYHTLPKMAPQVVSGCGTDTLQRCAVPSSVVASTASSRGAKTTSLQDVPGESRGNLATVCSLVECRSHTAPEASAVANNLERWLASKAVTEE